MKRTAVVEPHNATMPTSVRHLIEALPTDELERLAIEVIREHRRRLGLAQALFDKHEATNAPTQISDQDRHDYHLAVLNLHGQHELVALLIAALGYVPEVDCAPAGTPASN